MDNSKIPNSAVAEFESFLVRLVEVSSKPSMEIPEDEGISCSPELKEGTRKTAEMCLRKFRRLFECQPERNERARDAVAPKKKGECEKEAG